MNTVRGRHGSPAVCDPVVYVRIELVKPKVSRVAVQRVRRRKQPTTGSRLCPHVFASDYGRTVRVRLGHTYHRVDKTTISPGN